MIHRISKLLMLCLFTHDAIALAGECDTDTLEFVKNKGGKDNAIMYLKKAPSDLKRFLQSSASSSYTEEAKRSALESIKQDSRELIAKIQSCSQSDLASTTQQKPQTNTETNSGADCPDETSSEYAIFKYLGNGRFACANKINRIFGDCMTAANVDTWFKGSPMGLEQHEQRHVVAWAHCKLDNDRSWNAKGSRVRGNVGSAIDSASHNEVSKSALSSNKSQSAKSQASGEENSSNQDSDNASKSKYVSRDAAHCVEIIPKGFKGCTWKRCFHNTCGLEKISVWARGGGSTSDGLYFLSPGQNSPVNSIFDDGSPVRYQACSWDRKAGSGGPYRNPCRY